MQYRVIFTAFAFACGTASARPSVSKDLKDLSRNAIVDLIIQYKANGTTARGDDLIASYSSKGPTLIDQVVKPDIVAPGNKVVSLNTSGFSKLSQSQPANRVGAYYFRLNGTSMAAPVVSGAAAVLLEKEPGLTPDQVKARLMKTASKSFPAYSVAAGPVTGATYYSRHDIFTVGSGYLDVNAALASTDTTPASASARSPLVVYDAVRTVVKVVPNGSRTRGTAVVWGKSVVWGTSVLWGTSVVWGTHAFVDGPSVVWGTDAAEAASVVWGTAEAIALSMARATSTLGNTSALVRGET